MIELLLKLIDRLVQLKTYRAERAGAAFDEVFQPLFDDLLLVHADYIKMFDSVLRRLEQGGTGSAEEKLVDARDYLRSQRLELEPLRTKIRAMSDELQKTYRGEHASAFVGAVLEYFSTDQRHESDTQRKDITPGGITVGIDLGTSPSSLLSAGLGAASWLPKPSFASNVRASIDNQRQRWARVCESFAALKVKNSSQ